MSQQNHTQGGQAAIRSTDRDTDLANSTGADLQDVQWIRTLLAEQHSIADEIETLHQRLQDLENRSGSLALDVDEICDLYGWYTTVDRYTEHLTVHVNV